MAASELEVHGYLTVSRYRKQPKVGNKPGYYYVEVLVYGGPEKTGEPVLDWVMPKGFQYNLDLAARTVVEQNLSKLPPLTEGV